MVVVLDLVLVVILWAADFSPFRRRSLVVWRPGGANRRSVRCRFDALLGLDRRRRRRRRCCGNDGVQVLLCLFWVGMIGLENLQVQQRAEKMCQSNREADVLS